MPEYTFLSSVDAESYVARLDKANARAAAKGLVGRYVHTTRIETRRVQVSLSFTPERQVTIVDVDGTAPAFGGWQFVATLDNDASGVTVVRLLPGYEGALVDRDRPSVCDHCGSDRYRTRVFVVEHSEHGRKQVGSSCITDFLGISVNPSYWDECTPEEGEHDAFGDYFGRGLERTFTIASVVEVALAVTRAFGFVRSNSFSGNSTAERVREVLSGTVKREDADKINAAYRERDTKTVEAIIAWVSEQYAGSEFIANAKALVEAGVVGSRNVALIAALPVSYDRAQAKAIDRAVADAQRAQSQHVGVVGERSTFADLTVSSVRYIESVYGTKTLYTFVDPSGNTLKWFSTSTTVEFAQGDKTSLVASVKKHEEYRGNAETVITRAKIAAVNA